MFVTILRRIPGRQRTCKAFAAMLSAALLLTATGCGFVPWRYDFDGALRSAAARKQRAVVLFTSADSEAAREMDMRTFSDAKVQNLMREFVPVRLDYHFNKQRAEQMGVTQPPAILVVRPDGTVAGSEEGYLDAEALRLFLIKNRYN